MRLTLIWALLIGLGASQDEVRRRPNVVLISIDDLNDWTGCLQGHPQAKTPHIDRLARSGTLFTNAHCQSPVCQPSRASLMTSRLPSTTGLYFLNPGIAQAPKLKGVLTLPERFAKEGYEVAAAGKLYHGRENHRYFTRIGTYAGNFGGFGPRAPRKIGYPRGHPLWDWGAFPNEDGQMPDRRIADWAARRLKAPFPRPFLLCVGFHRPHVPMLVPKRWFDLHPRTGVKLPHVPESDLEDVPAYARDLTTLEHVSPPHPWVVEHGEWQHAVQAYLASVSFVDACVGRVIAALKASPHAENTIVLLFSDHGFHLGEKAHWAKRTLWEDATRVPLIVTGPGVSSRRECKRPVSLLDVYPTLLDLCRLAPDPQHEGTTLRPLLDAPTAPWFRPALTFFGPGNVSVRTTSWRYIRYVDGSEELYRTAQDPHEWTNLASAPEHAVTKAELAAKIPRLHHPALGRGSTGHRAYRAAARRRK